MAKKQTKAKSSPDKKQAPKQKTSPSSPSRRLYSKGQTSGRVIMWLFVTAILLAISIYLYQYEGNNHKPMGYVDIEHHEKVPVQAELLSNHPKVYMLRNVLSDDECDDIITQAKQAHRIPSITGTRNTNKTNTEEHEWRRSTTSWLRKDEPHASETVKKLLSRIAAAANVSTASLQRGNPLHVTEYESGGFYMPHTDSLHLETLQPQATVREYTDLDGFAVEGGYPHSARYFTALCYLSDDFEGGQTIFPLYDNDTEEQPSKNRLIAMQNANSEQTMGNWERLLPSICEGTSVDGMSIAPERGSCVLFYNHFVDDKGMVGQLDGQSLHAGCTVKSGSNKWIANVWAEAIPTDAVRREAKRMASTEL